ncbi:MAG: GH92 family glycosyl hydrolase [bacterium]
MKKLSVLALCLLFLFATGSVRDPDPVDYVNPYIGTHGGIGPSLYGGMIPGVTRPFGMVQWTPMTRLNKIGGCPYRYGDHTIMGFQGTRQPAVWMGDYGYVSVMPGQGEVEPGFKDRDVRFSHDDEKTTPYYYHVEMGDMKTELAASVRSSIMRFSFKGEEEPHLVIDASREQDFSGSVTVDPDNNRIIGYNTDRHSAHLGPPLPNFKGHFVIEFDTPITGFGIYKGEELVKGTAHAEGDRLGAFVKFEKGTKSFQARIGTSLISLSQAEENLKKEIPGWDLDKIKNEGRAEWNRKLGRIEVEGGTRDDKVNFYTGMYHAHLYPRIFSEYGRYYSAFDDEVHEGVAYNDYSLWDTFRAEHPLLILTSSERVGDMMKSLLQMYEEGGWLPKWPNPTYTGIMIGSHADSVLADAWVKGIRGFDLDKAYEATRKNAMVPPEGDKHKKWGDRDPWTSVESRGGLYWYKKLGYVPVDKTAESVSRTLEFAYDDFCVAQLAKAAGETEDYKTLMQRSKNYKNLYQDGYFQGRKSDGSWAGHKGYTESVKWGYMFCAMQDVQGMIEMMGGPEDFENKLDKVFVPVLRIYRYTHTNEPVHHYIYLYDYSGSPWKAQKQARLALDKYYHNKPAGLVGNDDCGQMSAWYIFSSMGFYPVTPGTDLYAMGSPLWDKVRVHIGEPYDEATFEVVAENQAPDNYYIQSATLNGEPLNTPFLKHSDIVQGGKLVLEMGSEPNKQWGTK